MLAIVIPYYKIAFFKETLDSLSNQTDKRFKVYIGNDASPESPEKLLSEFTNKLNFKYKRFENNLGGKSLVNQWNRCLALVEDEKWILFLGDDDYLSNNAVEEFYNNLKSVDQENINVIRYSLIKIDDKNNKLTKPYIHPKFEKSTDFIIRRRKTSLSEYVFKKEQILKIGFKDFPSALFSDIVAVLEFSNYATIFTLNEANVFVRISTDNVSGHSIDMKQHFKAEKKYYLHLLKNINFFNDTQKRFIYNRINNQIVKNFKKDFYFIFSVLFHYLFFSLKDFKKLISNYFKTIVKKHIK
ncbi:MAG: glycosyltransferase family 2 protein [Flavobacteriales bacterium]|nr:glycosyltransferase family 2 protein [Flavobacteriales bacterium]